MNVVESMYDHFKIIVMLFVVIFGFGFFGALLLQDAGFGYNKEN